MIVYFFADLQLKKISNKFFSVSVEFKSNGNFYKQFYSILTVLITKQVKAD